MHILCAVFRDKFFYILHENESLYFCFDDQKIFLYNGLINPRCCYLFQHGGCYCSGHKLHVFSFDESGITSMKKFKLSSLANSHVLYYDGRYIELSKEYSYIIDLEKLEIEKRAEAIKSNCYPLCNPYDPCLYLRRWKYYAICDENKVQIPYNRVIPERWDVPIEFISQDQILLTNERKYVVYNYNNGRERIYPFPIGTFKSKIFEHRNNGIYLSGKKIAEFSGNFYQINGYMDYRNVYFSEHQLLILDEGEVKIINY